LVCLFFYFFRLIEDSSDESSDESDDISDELLLEDDEEDDEEFSSFSISAFKYSYYIMFIYFILLDGHSISLIRFIVNEFLSDLQSKYLNQYL
jgi:hypothetical protein